MTADEVGVDLSTRITRRWFPFRAESPAAQVRLFCIPHAGAGATAYLSWARGLPCHIEVCGVELPGRATRVTEPLHRHTESLVEQLAYAIRPLLDLPYLLHGHSMGALLAFETARLLQKTDMAQPAGLVVSGMVGPARWPVRPAVHHLDTPQLMAHADFLGLPSDIVADEELLALVLPTLRADLELTEAYRYRKGPPLRCPVTVFAGMHDELTPLSALREWSDVTTDGCTMQVFEGGHFFLHECPNVLNALETVVASTFR